MDPDSDVDIHFPPFLRTYKSGRVERLLGTAVVPAGLDPATAVASKDVPIDPATNLSARLYLPKVNSAAKLPILVYFHGGAFIIESASSPTYHNFLNSLAAAGGLLTVSVDYRRAPEHPLPAAHDDSWAALQWVFSQSDPWLAEHGDFNRLFLAGDSAGANIAHHMALRAGARVSGLAMIHPYFAGEARHPREAEVIEKVLVQGFAGADELLLVPKSFEGMVCKRVVVFLAEKDGLRERGRGYYDGLAASGWGGEAELVENAGEDHVFHLIKPDCESAAGLRERLVEFFKGLFSTVLTTCKTLLGPKYDGIYLHDLIKDKLKSTRLNETLTNIVIPTFDIAELQPAIFSTFQMESKKTAEVLLSDICIGTSAAPTYLPAHHFKTAVKEFNLIDGGVAADNPALVAICEMFKWDPSILRTTAIEKDQLLVLSLGTGARKLVKKYSAIKASKWGVLGWLLGDQSNPLIDVFTQASDDMVDIYLAVLFQTLNNEENYLRIQDDTLKEDVCVLDIATGECTKKLLKVGEHLLKKDVSRVNLETGKCVPVNKGQNSNKITNEDALISFAKQLSDEKKHRAASNAVPMSS